MNRRIMAVDPGEKRIGLALSNPTQTIASPLTVILHRSKILDAAKIVDFAKKNDVERIIVGQNLDSNGEPTFQGRRARRMADLIQAHNSVKVEMWDESGSTRRVQITRQEMNISRKKREIRRDDLAAMMILQDYLDSHAKQTH